ncbi:MAG: Nucleoside-diphosphate-sugar epimerase [Acidobacteria bacterium]|nr:Nucleoside-diphosphate-sugar epimerase [Acidobacteriota bacterium]
MKALVTGANGHLGANIVRLLVAQGTSVRGLVRPKADVRGLAGVTVEVVHGDVLEPDSLPAAMDSVEVLYHCAAVYKTWAKDPAEIVRPSVEGTRNVLGAAAKAGVKRVVFTSSVAAVGAATVPDQGRDETHWNEDRYNAYYEAKTLGEREAWKISKETGLEMCAVNPSVIVGPFDYRVTPSMSSVRDLTTGAIPRLNGGYSWVHVEDVARAHLLAAEKGTNGERYIASGTNASMSEVADALIRLTGHGSTRSLPGWLVFLVADVSGAVAKVTGGKPLVARDMLDETIGKWQYYRNDKARRDLGYSPRGLDETLIAGVRWLAHTKEFAEPLRAELAAKFPAEVGWS